MAVNATVLGPGDFVRVYLDALARGDAQSALALPGVDAGDADSRLLVDEVLTGVSDVRQLSDTPLADDNGAGTDRHRVVMAWSTPGGDGTTEFLVERVGTRLGLFPEWGFAQSPVAVLSLDVLHDPRFTANGVAATTGLEAEGPATLAVLVPGSYVLSHETTFLRATSVTVVADEAGATLDATVDVEPGPRFAGALADEVDRQLAACAEQTVLFPTGCPFGQQISNRVTSEPQWSIDEAPELEIEPGPFGVWTAGPATGFAHLSVEVQSLFDGSLSTFDQNVPFEAGYTVVIRGDALVVSLVG